MLSPLLKGLKHRSREARLHQQHFNLNQVLTYITNATDYQKRAIRIKLQEGGSI
jgi:hypothetical protein